MTVIRTEEFREWYDRALYGPDDEWIGTIDDIYVDEHTGQPDWLAVSTGLFGSNVSFVPIAQAQSRGEDVIVPFGKDMVKDAPNAEKEGFLSPAEEARLFSHYGLDPGAPGPLHDDAMTRSEEELRVAKDTQESDRARLRRWERVTKDGPSQP